MYGGLTLPQAGLIFLVIGGAALVPWHLHQSVPVSEDMIGTRPAETPVVQALVGGMPVDEAWRSVELLTDKVLPALT